MLSSKPNIFVIIRGARERTEELCVSIVERIVGRENFILLNEDSFNKAHLRCLEIGSSLSRYEYFIFLDADVILDSDFFWKNVLGALNRNKDKLFYMLNFMVFDRQSRSPFYAGVHLYQSKTLKFALKYKNEVFNNQKPETYICKLMARDGYKTYLSNSLLGYHGFEQYYIDMYRTAFVRAVKYSTHWDFYLSTFHKYSKPYNDYFFSLLGCLDGITFKANNNDMASLKREYYVPLFNEYLQQYEISEKTKIDLDNFTPLNYQNLTSNINPLFEINKYWLAPSQVGFNQNKSFLERLIKKLRNFKLNE